MTINLGAPQVGDNQLQKETTINDAIGRLDAALTDVMTLAIDSSNAADVTALDFKSHGQFDCTDNGATGTVALTMPASVRRGLFVVTNSTGQTVSVGVTGQGTPPTMADGDIALFFCDGSTARKIA